MNATIEEAKQLLPATISPTLPASLERAPSKDIASIRNDQIAELLSAAYQKASTLKLTDEECSKMTAQFPDEAVCRGANGDPNLLYIGHAWVRDRLHEVFGPGRWALINRRTWLDGDQGYMYADCVLLARGAYIGEAIGAQRWTAKNARLNYSDAVEAAQSEALRRIAGKYLGIGLEVWKANYCEDWKSRHPVGERVRPSTIPTSRSQAKLVIAPTSPSEPFPTATSREKMIAALQAGPGQPNRDIVTEFFRKCCDPSCLTPTEQLEDLPLRFVPATAGQMRALGSSLAAFGGGEMAGLPYAPHKEPATSTPPPPKVEAKPEPEPEESGESGSQTVTGEVQAVSEKSGTSAKGPWTRYAVQIDGAWFSSFDKKIGPMMMESEGRTAVVGYDSTEKGNNIVTFALEGGE